MSVFFPDKSSSSALKELQQKYKDLKKEKDDMEHDFGVKRARFKHIYLECEGKNSFHNGLYYF